MFLNSVGYYVPQKRVDNQYFSLLNNLDEDWFIKRTGIHTRSRTLDYETVDFMSVQATNNALLSLPFKIEDVDLIISASYTPNDTIATTAHYIQREFQITNAKVFSLSAACSSAINGIEIIRSYFQTGIASKALLICAERNSMFSDDNDCENGHLWGDAAVSLFFSTEKSDKCIELIDITSQGLGHIGKGPEAVSLNLNYGKLKMPYGKDVFQNACTYMKESTVAILKLNGYKVADLDYFIGHQANKRILNNVCDALLIPDKKTLSNLEKYGNTGCVGAILVMAENYELFQTGDLICVTVFGGGYSVGSSLFIAR